LTVNTELAILNLLRFQSCKQKRQKDFVSIGGYYLVILSYLKWRQEKRNRHFTSGQREVLRAIAWNSDVRKYMPDARRKGIKMYTDVSNSSDDDKPRRGTGLLALGAGQSAGSRGGLEWWYRLAAPTEPPNATPRDRERVRAGRLASIILCVMFCFGLEQLPTALTSKDHFFLFILGTAMAINIGVFLLNRRGQVMVGGVIMVIVVEIAFIMVVLTSPTGISPRILTIFDLMVLTELMAVSLLPPKSVFLTTLCNCLFTWAAISFLPHTADLLIATPSSYYSALANPIVLQIIVALVTYLWVQGARQAIERAEQAVALERAIAERDRTAAEQKKQLELGIQQILQTQVQAANGNFEVRAPLAKDNVLWQVAHSLNNLLVRLQRANQTENEFQQTRIEAGRLTDAVRYAKASRRPMQQLQRNGTVLDPLAQELSGASINQPG
jgi:hypothetical protein